MSANTLALRAVARGLLESGALKPEDVEAVIKELQRSVQNPTNRSDDCRYESALATGLRQDLDALRRRS